MGFSRKPQSAMGPNPYSFKIQLRQEHKGVKEAAIGPECFYELGQSPRVMTRALVTADGFLGI